MKFKKLISKKGFKKAVTAVLTLTMLFSSVVSVFAAGAKGFQILLSTAASPFTNTGWTILQRQG